MRKISFKLLTQSSILSIDTDATTFGQLKEEVKVNGLDVSFENNQFIDRATKVSYGAIDEAILPVVDSIFFVVPLKTKSGMNVDSMSYLQVRQAIIDENKKGARLSILGSTDTLKARLKDYILTTGVEETSNETLAECIQIIRENVTNILDQVEILETLKVGKEEVLFGVTLDQLKEEGEQLRKLLS